VGLTALNGEDVELVGGGEGRPGRGSAAVDGAAVEEAVGPVLVEVFIEPEIVLLGVVVGARIEVAVIDDGRVTRDVVGGGGAAGAAEELRGSALNAGEGEIGRLVLVEQSDFGTVGSGGGGEGDESWIFKGAVGGSIRSQREVGLVPGEEEELVVGMTGPPTPKDRLLVW